MTHNILPFLAFLPLFALVFVVLMMIPYWMIWKKAGFSPWLSLFMLVPLLNLVMLYILAFTEWRVAPAPASASLRQY